VRKSTGGEPKRPVGGRAASFAEFPSSIQRVSRRSGPEDAKLRPSRESAAATGGEEAIVLGNRHNQLTSTSSSSRKQKPAVRAHVANDGPLIYLVLFFSHVIITPICQLFSDASSRSKAPTENCALTHGEVLTVEHAASSRRREAKAAHSAKWVLFWGVREKV
jgi:hypothetical protein